MCPSLSSFKRKFSSVDQDVVEKPNGPSCKQVKLSSIFTRDKQASRLKIEYEKSPMRKNGGLLVV